MTHGLARYRRGDFSEAIESCNKCQTGDPTDSMWARAALAYFVESLAHVQLGANEDAHGALDRGRAILDNHSELGASWHDQLIAKLILDEVEGLVANAERDNAER